jgi:hypothetical protein
MNILQILFLGSIPGLDNPKILVYANTLAYLFGMLLKHLYCAPLSQAVSLLTKIVPACKKIVSNKHCSLFIQNISGGYYNLGYCRELHSVKHNNWTVRKKLLVTKHSILFVHNISKAYRLSFFKVSPS